MDDTLFFTQNPLASVQLIPIINYLNLLSDFLFLEYYLAEVNQNKQIPIVNALYEYLEEYPDDDGSRKEKLIRKLLQGSDLYGAQDSEEVDVVFVSAMFDYIISSLVFDKYGNIYGFLADVVRKMENLQINHVLLVVKETLKNATFENEYGANSVLTNLAVNRIYNDIILPLFPQPDTNLSILSLDYIFAQAGSMYLRLGKINDTYYPSNDNSHYVEINKEFKNTAENNFFNQCLAIGHVLKKLIHSGKMDPLTLRVFALSALFHYVSTENPVEKEATRKLIFSSHHWKAAYRGLFQYLDNSFERIENQLMKDYTYKIHLAFEYFQNYAAFTNFVLNLKCRFVNKYFRETLPNYMEIDQHVECKSGFVLPNIKDWFQDQIHNVGEIYGEYDLEITKQSFHKFSIEDLRYVLITLLFTNNGIVNGHFKSSPNSYDLLEFYSTKTDTFDYYALIRENNTVVLIKDSDDPEYFREKLNPFMEQVIKSGHRKILKNVDENTHKLSEELAIYGKEQINADLRYLDDSLKRNEWWKKFGLSLVPSYQCLLKITNQDDIKNNLCEKNKIKFVNEFQEDTSQLLTRKDTESLLSSLGTTIKTIFLKDSINAIVDEHDKFSLLSQMIDSPLKINGHTMDAVYDRFSLEIEKPAFVSLSTRKNDVSLVSTIVDDLQTNLNYNFASVKKILNETEFLQTVYVKQVRDIDEMKNRRLFVNARNDGGFGYKFVMINTSRTTFLYTQLRTGYELKDELLLIPMENTLKGEKTYVKLNNTNFEIEPHYIYEINNQLRTKSAKVRFSGISTYYKNNDKCDDYEYIKHKENRKNCLRHLHFMEKTILYEQDSEKLLRRKGILKTRDYSSQNYVRNVLKSYTFANDSAFIHFIDNWIMNNSFEKSDWSSKNIIDKSGILRKLMYDVHLGKCNLSLFDGKSGIDSIYTYRERRKIEDGTSLENIIQDYNEQRACYSVTFEDYYAIRNFATTGDTRITGDTTEAKLIKIALYKLAVRQFEDFGEGFELKLFRIETKPLDFITQLYEGKRVVLQKFTMTSTSQESATRFAGYPLSTCENFLYEIHFNGPYFRAKIETKVDGSSSQEKQVILLPGSEFTITEVSTVTNVGGIGNATKVVLTSTFDNDEKFEWYKKIMKEITRIKL